jgi:hypothetical protein
LSLRTRSPRRARTSTTRPDERDTTERHAISGLTIPVTLNSGDASRAVAVQQELVRMIDANHAGFAVVLDDRWRRRT